MQEPFKIIVNAGQHQFDLKPEDALNLDIVPNGASAFHVLYEGISYQATVKSADFEQRSISLEVNGRLFQVHIADHYERLVQQLGLSAGGKQKQNIIKAPMPGLVISILVEAGRQVVQGEPLLILEAMKMENVLKAASDGQVKSVHITQGTAVEKGQLLLEME